MGTNDLHARFDACKAVLGPRGQEHVLRWWPELDDSQKHQLLAQIEAIPWAELDPVIESHVIRKPDHTIPSDLAPAPVYPVSPGPQQAAEYERARRAGHELISDGKVGAFTVAGGQGTRLGFDGPKGALPVSPVGEISLFEIFAATIRTVRRRTGVALPWYIMTSPANHDDTVEFFRTHDYFELPEQDVMFFPQAMLPAFDHQGRLLLAEKHSLALAPDGHGGALKALVASGTLADMSRRDIDIISYFQVDNPLVKPFDPLFIGLHAATGSEMSTKVTAKADDLERVGNLCLADGRLTVIEYSDLPESVARARDADGNRLFDAGNLAIHLLDPSFVDRMISKSLQLPFRRADKIVPCIDETGKKQTPTSPNGVKLETFIFDVLPLANNPMVLEVDRAEEFSPVKNAKGTDSLATARQAQVDRACRWLELAGVSIPRKPDGRPDVTVFISPAFAIDADDVQRQTASLPALSAGATLLLE